MESATVKCPREDCEGFVDVKFWRQGHPYGSTVAYEDMSEIDIPSADLSTHTCPEEPYTSEEQDEIYEEAQRLLSKADSYDV